MNPIDLSNDSDPAFIAEFHKNLKILSQDLYLSTNNMAQGQTPNAAMRASRAGIDMSSAASAAAVSAPTQDPTATLFDQKSMQDRLAKYARECGLSPGLLDKYLEDSKAKNTQKLTPVVVETRDPSAKSPRTSFSTTFANMRRKSQVGGF